MCAAAGLCTVAQGAPSVGEVGVSQLLVWRRDGCVEDEVRLRRFSAAPPDLYSTHLFSNTDLIITPGKGR